MSLKVGNCRPGRSVVGWRLLDTTVRAVLGTGRVSEAGLPGVTRPRPSRRKAAWSGGGPTPVVLLGDSRHETGTAGSVRRRLPGCGRPCGRRGNAVSGSARQGAHPPRYDRRADPPSCSPTPAPETGLGAAALDDLRAVAEHGRAGNGRFFGYVMGSGEPVGALGDLLRVRDQPERDGLAVGSGNCGDRARGGLLAGRRRSAAPASAGHSPAAGRSRNLMGLAMAREARRSGQRHGGRRWVSSTPPPRCTCPSGRPSRLLGLGRDNLRLLPADDDCRITGDALRRAVAADRSAGPDAAGRRRECRHHRDRGGGPARRAGCGSQGRGPVGPRRRRLRLAGGDGGAGEVPGDRRRRLGVDGRPQVAVPAARLQRPALPRPSRRTAYVLPHRRLRRLVERRSCRGRRVLRGDHRAVPAGSGTEAVAVAALPRPGVPSGPPSPGTCGRPRLLADLSRPRARPWSGWPTFR